MFASFRGPELDFSVAAAGDEEVGGLLNERAAIYRVKEDFSLLVRFLLKLLLPLEGEFRRVVGANGFSMAEESRCRRRKSEKKTTTPVSRRRRFRRYTRRKDPPSLQTPSSSETTTKNRRPRPVTGLRKGSNKSSSSKPPRRSFSEEENEQRE